MGKFIISRRSNGDFQFYLEAANGQIFLRSEGYYSKAACLNGINSVRVNSQANDKIDRKISSNGRYYFNLKANNGQVIGTSEMFETEEDCENGILFVRENAHSASFADQTE